MRTLIKTGTLLGTLFMAASGAHAGLVVDLDEAVSGEADYYSAGNNDLLGNTQGYYGAQIYVTGNTTLKFEFLGAESWWRTVFDVENEQGEQGKLVHRTRAGTGNGEKVDTGGAIYNQPFTMTFAGDSLLDFKFTVSKTTGEGEALSAKVNNGMNPLPERSMPGEGEALPIEVDDDMGPLPERLMPAEDFYKQGFLLQETAFWTGLEYADDSEGELQAVYLGFNDGWSRDYDFDDMVVRISTVTEVPLPASIPFFVFSLMSLGFFKRK